MSTKASAAMFEKKAKQANETQTNAKHKKEVVWTPNNHSDNHGAHTQTGYSAQTKNSANGPPKKKSLADLP